MSTARVHVGDVRTVLATLPADSVDVVITSPPFLALRSYLPADHPDKKLELGSEATPGEYIDHLLDVVEACDRVLAPHGSICIELGDTYAGSGGAGGDYGEGGLRDGQPLFKSKRGEGMNHRNDKQQMAAVGMITTTSGERAKANAGAWPTDKSLTMIPELFRFALAYGFNPLTGRTTPTWRIRNVIRWTRPNPPVGALGDKMRPATSDMVIACHARNRYFDLDAVRTEPKRADNNRMNTKNHVTGSRADDGQVFYNNGDPAGAPPNDWWLPLPEEQTLWDQWADQLWKISTNPYAGAHYATFPPALVVRPIQAMCPRKVCTVCGEPSRRITEPTEEYASRPNYGKDFLGSTHDRTRGMAARTERRPGSDPARNGASFITLGWTDCGCPGDHWRTGVVLDPFAGSGTTGEVATGHGRDCILIDLDGRNLDLMRARIGMFLEEDDTTAPVLTGGQCPAENRYPDELTLRCALPAGHAGSHNTLTDRPVEWDEP